MVKKYRAVFLFLTIVLILPISVFAHPGRTDRFGCYTCKTNCESWGLKYGEYHCHNEKVKTESIQVKNTAKIEAKKTTKTKSK